MSKFWYLKDILKESTIQLEHKVLGASPCSEEERHFLVTSFELMWRITLLQATEVQYTYVWSHVHLQFDGHFYSYLQTFKNLSIFEMVHLLSFECLETEFVS